MIIKYFVKISIFLNFFQLFSSENVNSFSKIYNSDGNGKFHKTDAVHNKVFLERSSLILKQAEWNIVKMGNDKFLNKCKRVHLKNLAVESKAWV